jgi:gliding motility-associated lipoprotein GldH
MLKNICLLLLSLTLFSCDSNVVLESFSNDFKDNRWMSEDYREFDFTIEKDGNYEVQLHFGHIHKYQIPKVDVQIEITTPDGTVKVIPMVLEMQSETLKSDCMGDICDLFVPIVSDNMIQGNHKIVVKNTSKYPYLPDVLAVGIRIVSKK